VDIASRLGFSNTMKRPLSACSMTGGSGGDATAHSH
jgi:hypothetical protein